MKRDRSRLVAFGLFVLWAAIAAGSLILAWSNRPFTSDLRGLDSSDLVFVAASALFSFTFAIVGGVVAARTGQAIGWLLMVVAITYQQSLAGEQYALYGLVSPRRSLPGATFAALAGSWTFFVFTIAALTLVLLLFPTGTVRTPRWRPILVASPVAAALWVGSEVLRPGKLDINAPGNIIVTNPLGLEALADVIGLTSSIGTAVLLGCLAASVLGLVLRFRSSRGIERQQIKWLAFVASAAAVGLIATFLAALVMPHYRDAIGSIGWGVFVVTLMLGLPVSVGVAILRYRLYDIDRIISRTATYAIVTALLVGLYALVAVVVPAAILGTRDTPDAVIAGATLLVAAAFVPVRRRVQNAVDRRFNRARYDAAQTIGAFTARLREEIDIDALEAELERIVSRTMRPTQVSLWLREAHVKPE